MLREHEEDESTFQDYYLQFLAEDIGGMKKLIASHLHVAFQNSK